MKLLLRGCLSGTKATDERLTGFEEQVDDRFDHIDASVDTVIRLHQETDTQPTAAETGPNADPE